jgi:SAM-dependent methyltransferase
MKEKWINWWNDDQKWMNDKKENFEIINSAIDFRPERILDIGCGLAVEAEMFQKKYGSSIYLLDGDWDSTKDNTRDIKYGPVTNFKFYSNVETLKESWESRDLEYTFIDASAELPELDITFDLVISNQSCGFHYPVNTYSEFIKLHTNSKSVVIMDIRDTSFSQQAASLNVISKVSNHKKHTKYRIEVL